ncbi:sigma-E factor negative regulatory protein [Cellvibrio sp. OA-2007]|uniref:sigma-E factor negative regulatory protein n=1 Tax=Cellvibrio sp. OA-2007 TaxID=529823 RepID=UPI000A05DE92|nr:sigma-E factor negative regulatory protein [Cellvibrio sp. OA-2007]
MTEQIQPPVLAESLSALMDNQASELEIQRLLKALDASPELKSTWSRYQIASAGLKGELPVIASSDFASRISAAIDAEETYTLKPQAALQPEANQADSGNVVVMPLRWWQQAGRVAVAASVAGALIVGVQQYQTVAPQTAEFAVNNAVSAPVAATETKAANLPSGINAPALSARTVAVQSGYESRPQENRRVMFVPRQEAAPIYNEDVSTYVNQLIQEHTDNASINSGQGMLPYTRVILVEEE